MTKAPKAPKPMKKETKDAPVFSGKVKNTKGVEFVVSEAYYNVNKHKLTIVA